MLDIRVGDMVMIPGRFWRVTGIYIGGIGYENVVELQIVDRKQGQCPGGNTSKLMVPEDLITQKMLYRSTQSLIEESETQAPTPLEVEMAAHSIPR